MLRFYWSLGRDIVARDAENVYGSGFYRNLSQDLKAAIPEAEGFSRQNLQYMKKMYLLYSEDSANCPQLVGNSKSEICPQAVGDFIFSVPWGHHRTLIDKYFETGERETALFYVHKYVNKFNRGVTRVQEMLKDNGNPPAEFDVNTITAFRVNVNATNESDLSKGTSQPLSQPLSQPPSQPPSQSIDEMIVEFCKKPRSSAEIAVHCGFKDVKNFRERYLTPLLGSRIQMTIPNKPTSRFQKYIATIQKD